MDDLNTRELAKAVLHQNLTRARDRDGHLTAEEAATSQVCIRAMEAESHTGSLFPFNGQVKDYVGDLAAQARGGPSS